MCIWACGLWGKIRHQNSLEDAFHIHLSDEKRILVLLADSLKSILIPDLLALVKEYAAHFLYTWTTSPREPILINKNELICGSLPIGQQPWSRVVASLPVCEGSNRWKIAATFSVACVGYLAVGISKTNKLFPPPANFEDTITKDDCFLSTTTDVADALRGVCLYQNGRWKTVPHQMWIARGNKDTCETVILVQCNLMERTMTIGFKDVSNEAQEVTIHILGDEDWFPCVAVSRNVKVTIFPWE